MNDQLLQQDSQGFLDPDNRDTLLKFLRGRNTNVSDEMIDIVNRMAPLRVMEKVIIDSSLSPEAKVFFRKIEATNNGAKPGENFEDFLWRYIESDNVPAIAEDELDGLAEVYEKVSGIQPESKLINLEEGLETEKNGQISVGSETGTGIKLKVRSHPEDLAAAEAAAGSDGEEKIPGSLDEAEVLTGGVSEKKEPGSLKDAIKASQINLVKELGIDKLPQEEQEKALLEMGEVIQQRILLRVVEEFPEDKKDELLKLTENKDASPEEFNSFVEVNLPNIQEIVSDEVEKYKKEMLDFTKQVLGE